MRFHPRHLIRYGLAVLTAAVVVGCKSDGTGTDDGEIAIVLNPTSASVVQGGITTVTGTLTRSGGFTGTVQFGVTGNPPGVTAASTQVTTGLVTTATLTVTVGAAVTPGTYPLVVTGTGSGVTAATATFTLTVTAAPEPAYTLALLPAALSIVQGAATPTTTVTLVRTNFTGNVTLSVEGMPAGVTAAFAPNPATANTSVLTLTVGAAVAPAVYNLTVRGVATGLTDRTTPLTLTVTAAPTPSYTLSLTAAALTIQVGGNGQSTVTLVRTNFTNNVILTLEGAPAGVTGAFNPTSTSTNTSVLTVTVGAAVAPGVYNLVVRGVDAEFVLADRTAPLTLTVTAAAPTPSYTLSLTAAVLSIVQGASTPTTTVNVNRTNFAGDVTLSVTNLPAGVTAAFVPNPATGNSSVLTLTVGAAVAPGVYNLSVNGTATAGNQNTPLTLTVTAAGSFTLGITPAGGVTMVQGTANNSKTVTITRTNYTPAITLTAEGLPAAGLTAAFAPNPTATNSSVLTLTATAGLAPGVYNITIRGTGPAALRLPGDLASVEATTTLAVTVTAAAVVNFTLTTTPATSANVIQGSSTNVTVNLVRTGGFAGSVNLTVTGLVTGLTAGFTPTPAPGATSTLNIAAAGSLAVGTYPIVIRGNFTGLAEQTVNLNVIVTASGGGSGNVTVTFANCPADQKAVWFAFMDGTAGTWTAVTGVADVYRFNITQSKGSFAYVTLGTGGTSGIFVQHMTQAELTAAALDFCGVATPLPTRVANGTVSNLPAGALALLSWAGSFTTPFANGPFQFTNAAAGSFDLVGWAGQFTGPGAGDRVVVLRGENPAPGGNFSVPVNFTDATRSAAPATGAATLQGLVGGETQVNHSMSFSTGGSACVSATLYGLGTTAASFTMFGVPPSLRLGTDMHRISIFTSGPTSSRFMIENFLDIATRAATPFVLPAQLPVPVVTDAGGSYKRLSIAVTGVATEFNLSHSISYTDQTATGKFGFVSATQGWVGGPNFTLVLPNFAGVGVFNNAWAPATGDVLDWTFSSVGGNFTAFTGCTAGQRFVTSSRNGTL